ncbi:hypothetical protein ESY86_09075 [Subsaximicrobium wynnwilliamsii]|uniref:Uncharacterized protein n=1 Tax=Subsaximicrobium wynnwilliamsii TaxID=291179 RepID=A0A5C6ZJ39_9FLAO|nr:hypothetical protein ESY87_09735 [Subsaximicrobium wynnwilliamsii]TXD89200.1 hypothetical protein ESY86_09075 [Subsaximicrobium wynnwilliamsii]TXE03205.1 hypothetical protein ESY88_09445 [Subsaximicrobium wynnwilliamsii]
MHKYNRQNFFKLPFCEYIIKANSGMKGMSRPCCYRPNCFSHKFSVFSLPSSVFRLPSSVFRLPSSVFRPLKSTPFTFKPI